MKEFIIDTVQKVNKTLFDTNSNAGIHLKVITSVQPDDQETDYIMRIHSYKENNNVVGTIRVQSNMFLVSYLKNKLKHVIEVPVLTDGYDMKEVIAGVPGCFNRDADKQIYSAIKEVLLAKCPAVDAKSVHAVLTDIAERLNLEHSPGLIEDVFAEANKIKEFIDEYEVEKENEAP